MNSMKLAEENEKASLLKKVRNLSALNFSIIALPHGTVFTDFT